MADSGNGALDPRFAHLEQLPIETLETLLRKSASLPETEEHRAYVGALTEVIIRKEKEHPTGRLMDPEKSWQQVLSLTQLPLEDDQWDLFKDEEDLLELSQEVAVPPEEAPKNKAPQKPRRRRRFLALVAAAVVLISLLVVQVSAFPLLQTLERFFAQMTDEVFRYSAEDKPEGCVQLDTAMRELGMSRDFAISWYPDEFTLESTVSQSSSDWKFVHQRYIDTEERRFLLVTINWYEDISRISDNTSMKNESGEATEVYRGLHYYILPNEDEHIITWYCDHYSGTISGDLGEDELMDIFQSMGGIDS